jgi:hypothetical protein
MLLEFTSEIFENVVNNLVAAIGPHDSWKLRGVCKPFKKAITYDMFAKQPSGFFHCIECKQGHSLHDQYCQLLKANLDLFLYHRCRSLTALDIPKGLPRRLYEWVTYLSHELGLRDEEDTIRTELCKSISLNQQCVFYVLVYLRDGVRHYAWDGLRREITSHDHLVAATMYGSNELVRTLLPEVPNSDWIREWGDPLIIAATLGRTSIVETFLHFLEDPKFTREKLDGSRSVDLSKYDVPGAAICAIENHHLELAKYLLDWWTSKFENIHPYDYHRLLNATITATITTNITANALRILEYLLTLPVDGYRVGWLHIQEACTLGCASALAMLLEHRSPNLYGPSHMVPLCTGIRSGHLSIVKAMVNAGSIINTREGNQTVLQVAFKSKKCEIVEYLLDKGAWVPGKFDWPSHKEIRKVLQNALEKKGFQVILRRSRRLVTKRDRTKPCRALDKNQKVDLS